MAPKAKLSIHAQSVVAAGLFLVGILVLIFPAELAGRTYLLFENPAGHVWLIYGLGVALIGLSIALLTEAKAGARGAHPLAYCAIAGCSVLYFLLITMHLRDWWIDDAGITFAYSRSLAEGLGLVAQPWLPPEEGYSSSVWMLLLSGLSRLGADIPIAAKFTGIFFSALALAIVAWIVARETRSPLAVLISGIGIACAPTAVWAASGQEHALQSLILLLVVVCVYTLEHWRWPVALLFAVFVLVRPEAPIIVIAVFCAAVFLTRRTGGPLINYPDLAVALVPFVAFCVLIAFRTLYFGDPMPNPYYAKSSGAGLSGVLNPLGGGWTYILLGLRNTSLLFVIVLLLLIRLKPVPAWVIVAGAVLIGHAFFVIWAKGDWMRQYRFLMPVLPVLLLLVALGLKEFGALWRRAVFSLVSVLILSHTTIVQTAIFANRPTTPLAFVTEVGQAFRSLADRLEIEYPVLAHHDAGGIAYHRMIRLVDLGGLINRAIAKNMEDKAFLTEYLLVDVKPDFFFGAENFATASGFAETDLFEQDYVRITFFGKPEISSYLTHIRRNLVKPVPGIVLITDETGRLVELQVDMDVPQDDAPTTN